MNPAKNADEPTVLQGFGTALKNNLVSIAVAAVMAVGIIFAVPAAGSEEMPETRLGTAAGPSQAGQPLGWTGGRGAYAGGSGSQSGSGGSTTQSSSNSGDMGRDTPLVYKSQSSGPPVFDSSVWTGDEGGVQFSQVADPGKKGTAGGPPQSEGHPQAKSWSESFWDWFMGPDPAKGSLWKLGPSDVLRAGDSGTHNNGKSQVRSLEDGGIYAKIIIDGAINDGALAGAGAVVGKLQGAQSIVPKASTINGIKTAGKFDDSVSSLAEARVAIKKAFPDAIELPPAIPGKPYPSPPPGIKKWFQVHPPEPGVGNNLPHIKYADWTNGKKGAGGSWGHLFFPE